jgi:hypothetical protein
MSVDLTYRSNVISFNYCNEPLTLQNMNLGDQRVGNLVPLPIEI